MKMNEFLKMKLGKDTDIDNHWVIQTGNLKQQGSTFPQKLCIR
jgi:hypothetical protein